VKAATGEVISAEELGGADTHGRKSGVVDHVAENDAHALLIVRDIVATLNAPKQVDIDLASPRPPLHDPQDLYGIVPGDVRAPYDVREVIARIVDGSELHEFKALYGTTLVCGFARHLGDAGRDPGEQWRAVQRERAEGRAFHRARLPAPRAAAVPAEHLRLHGRREI
jgi:3-methylcrotonyl-CoA carboxylase beta subunit